MRSRSMARRSQHLDLESSIFLAECARRATEMARRADIGGQIREIARDLHAVGDRGAVVEAPLSRSCRGCIRDHQREAD